MEMRVAVWGAGQVGTATAYRLTTSAHVSELHWINKTYANIEHRLVDLQHGLAFLPSCHAIKGYVDARARVALQESELVVLTLGSPVPPETPRQEMFDTNARVFDHVVIPALRDFTGIVLIVTNPVESLAKHVHDQANLDPRRCLGLGTVVETARLRAALAKRMRPMRTPRDVFAYAVGTHDQHFVPVTEGATAMAANPWRPESIESARIETVNAAARVKQDHRSTLHPVVEGIVAVVEAIASDRRETLTVSTLDPTEQLFYSVPCTLGREGVIERHTDLLKTPQVQAQLQVCLAELRKVTRTVPHAFPEDGTSSGG